jgi:hypothetical protein
MAFEDIQFPVYRKYKNGKNFFKISNPLEFEELLVIGSNVRYKKTRAVQYPEILFIQDLLINYQSMADEASVEEFDSLRKLVKS